MCDLLVLVVVAQMTKARVQHIVTSEHDQLPGLLREESAAELAGSSSSQGGSDSFFNKSPAADGIGGSGGGGKKHDGEQSHVARPAVEAWGVGGGGECGRGMGGRSGLDALEEELRGQDLLASLDRAAPPPAHAAGRDAWSDYKPRAGFGLLSLLSPNKAVDGECSAENDGYCEVMRERDEAMRAGGAGHLSHRRKASSQGRA